jgi:hypothetical protein
VGCRGEERQGDTSFMLSPGKSLPVRLLAFSSSILCGMLFILLSLWGDREEGEREERGREYEGEELEGAGNGGLAVGSETKSIN